MEFSGTRASGGPADELSPNTSLYLDFFRLTCALIVVATHAFLPQMTATSYKFPFGEDAVIAFFVLSGFVISHAAASKERDAFSFSIARLARLWSVLIPALLIGPCFDLVGMHFNRSLYETWAPTGIAGHWLPQSLTSALFLNEIWFASLAPQFNVPVWSIGFEAWYYALFAIFLFGRGAARWTGLVLAALFMGPKILLLLPAWILGVALYRWRDKLSLSLPIAWALWVAGPAFVLIGHAVHAFDHLRELYISVLGAGIVYNDLGNARDFVWQNLVGIALTCHLAGAITIVRKMKRPPDQVSRIIKQGADLTYSIYLLHFPAQLMISAMLHDMRVGLLKIGIVLAGSLTISVSLGLFFEPLKLPLRHWLKRTFGRTGQEPIASEAS
jgi:peptidoglycan/LPS O-acetylase OafA/YrhL